MVYGQLIATPGTLHRQRPTRYEQIGGKKIRQTSNIDASFEFEASKIFNELPIACRNSLSYKDFCKQTKNYFLDKVNKLVAAIKAYFHLVFAFTFHAFT